jgi:hypothetical protein
MCAVAALFLGVDLLANSLRIQIDETLFGHVRLR